MGKELSVIIPAYNEERYILRAIQSYREQTKKPLEIIVVVNNSNDRTYEVSRQHADVVLHFPGRIGVSAARNEGAKVARGDILVFSDADSYLEPNALEEISAVREEEMVGSLVGKSDDPTGKGNWFFTFKNSLHQSGVYHGVIDGVMFCQRKVFERAGGFNPKREPDEFNDFIKRAMAQGAKYELITKAYAVTSLRRIHENGYWFDVWFWLQWKLFSLFKRQEKLTQEAEKYYDSIKK